MTRKDLEAKVANAQGTVEKRKNVLAKHRAQLEKLIANTNKVITGKVRFSFYTSSN